jgi:hypothetical protein
MIANVVRVALLLTITISAVCGFLGKPHTGGSHVTSPLYPSTQLASSASTSESAMVAEVKVGDKIPSVTLKEGLGDFQNREVNIADLIAGKKVALFGVPGAFTPG